MELIILAAVLLGLVIGLGLAIWQGWHSSEREQVLLAELESLRAVNRLSVAAWQARQVMRDEIRRQAERT